MLFFFYLKNIQEFTFCSSVLLKTEGSSPNVASNIKQI